MGLFSFFKRAGRKPEAPKAAPVETSAVNQDVINRQKASMLQSILEAHDFDVDQLNISVDDDHVVVNGSTGTQGSREKIILALGNVDGIASVEDNIAIEHVEPESTFYEVQPGDSLSKISKKVYGDAMKYNMIFEANQPMLSDPDKIYVGQTLRIPPVTT